MNYQEQLEDSRWKKKREEILKRDRYKCRKCGSKSFLHIHHKIYVDGRKAWEYTNQFLITLCSDCHQKEHQKKETKDFVTKDKKVIKHSNPSGKKKNGRLHKKKWMNDYLLEIKLLIKNK